MSHQILLLFASLLFVCKGSDAVYGTGVKMSGDSLFFVSTGSDAGYGTSVKMSGETSSSSPISDRKRSFDDLDENCENSDPKSPQSGWMRGHPSVRKNRVEEATVLVPEHALEENDKIKIRLYYNKRGSRFPRVYVSFLTTGQGPFELMLDTGSEKSHLMLFRLDLKNGYVPKPSSPAKRDSGTIFFGIPGKCERGVNYIANLEEPLVMHGENRRLSRPLAVSFKLTTEMDGEEVGVGLLGAGVSSDFAQAVGVFSYIPSLTRDSPGSLEIGSPDLVSMKNNLCEDAGFFSLPLMLEHSSKHWLVEGSSQVDNDLVVSDGFVLDTGAVGAMIHVTVFDRLVQSMSSLGATVAGSHFPIVTNCRDRQRFPLVTFRFGQLEIHLTPYDYLDHTAPGKCRMLLSSESLRNGEGKLLGMIFLNKVVTVFNQQDKEITLCKRRQPVELLDEYPYF